MVVLSEKVFMIKRSYAFELNVAIPKLCSYSLEIINDCVFLNVVDISHTFVNHIVKQ